MIPAVLLLLAAGAAPAPPVSPGAWLDAPKPTGWNRAGAPLPKAPKNDGETLGKGRCKEGVRPADGPEDAALVAAGWSLFAAQQRFGDAVLVLAGAGGDGMCRPLAIQAFVFVKGKLAGTLAPLPADSRTDGVLDEAHLFGGSIDASFRRYAPDDPLCCPSRRSEVVYRVETGANGSVVVPVSATTSPIPKE